MREHSVRGAVRGAAEPTLVEQVQDELGRIWACGSGVGPCERFAFELAVVEVVANAIRHARPLDDGVPVVLEVGVEIDPGRLLARVAELNAQPFRPGGNSLGLPGDGAETGRGLPMLDRLLSKLTCETTGSGNLWILELERSGPGRGQEAQGPW